MVLPVAGRGLDFWADGTPLSSRRSLDHGGGSNSPPGFIDPKIDDESCLLIRQIVNQVAGGALGCVALGIKPDERRLFVPASSDGLSSRHSVHSFKSCEKPFATPPPARLKLNCH